MAVTCTGRGQSQENQESRLPPACCKIPCILATAWLRKDVVQDKTEKTVVTIIREGEMKSHCWLCEMILQRPITYPRRKRSRSNRAWGWNFQRLKECPHPHQTRSTSHARPPRRNQKNIMYWFDQHTALLLNEVDSRREISIISMPTEGNRKNYLTCWSSRKHSVFCPYFISQQLSCLQQKITPIKGGELIVTEEYLATLKLLAS